MATLEEHQAAMVQLLANGSGIPASASRLAHAMHDVLAYLAPKQEDDFFDAKGFARLIEAKREAETTPGLNDKALSKREKALKTDSPAKWPTPAEQRVKELENTIRQLKANNAKLRAEKEFLAADRDKIKQDLNDTRVHLNHEMQSRDALKSQLNEQAGCRKEDTDWATAFQDELLKNAVDMAREAIKKADTQVWEPECDHAYAYINMDNKTLECGRCGHNVPWPDGFNPNPAKAPV